MTRLHVISDLHAEGDPDWRWPGPLPAADIVVVAGDVANGCVDSVRLLASVWWGRDVVFVPGNHDHFGEILQRNLDAGRKASDGSRVRLLHREACVLGGVRFLGCTLWTDYRLNGKPKPSMVETGRSIPDHQCIRIREEGGHVSRFMPWHAAAEHRHDLAFLVAALAVPFDGPTVVVTHHAPSGRSIAPTFAGSPLNPAFASDLEWLMERERPALWVHGHLHDACDYWVGDSMTEARMFDGDLAIVDRSLMPLDGDIVVVDVDGERSFKIWRERLGRVALSFANARYPAFTLREDAEVEVWGVVVNTIGLGRRCEVRPTKAR